MRIYIAYACMYIYIYIYILGSVRKPAQATFEFNAQHLLYRDSAISPS